MRERLRRDLTVALKTRDSVEVAALRSALAAIDNAEAPDPVSVSLIATRNEYVAGGVAGVGAAEGRRRVLTQAETTKLIRDEIAERLRAASRYRQLGKSDSADRLLAEVEVLTHYVR